MNEAEGRFREVVHTYGASLRRLARGHEASPARQEELVQEMLLALWQALPAWSGQASQRTYLFRVATNVAFKHRRAAAVRPAEAPEGVEPAAGGPDPEQHSADRQALHRLEQAVRALPDLDRQLVLLHLEGLGNAEIAEVLGLSTTAVGSRLHRLRPRLAAATRGEP